MKRIILLLSLALLLCLALAFAGCSQSSSQLPKSLKSKPIDDFSLRVDAGSIALLQWDTEFNLDELLGEPSSQHTERLGSGADTFQGSFIKKVKYESLEIELFSPKDNGKSFYILNFNITGRGFATGKGIQVGDTVADIKKVYPSLELAKDGRTDPDNCQYLIKDLHDFKYITFEVKAGKVKGIKIFYELQ